MLLGLSGVLAGVGVVIHRVGGCFINESLGQRLQRDEAIQRKRVPVMTQEAGWLEAGCSRGLPGLTLDVALDRQSHGVRENAAAYAEEFKTFFRSLTQWLRRASARSLREQSADLLPCAQGDE